MSSKPKWPGRIRLRATHRRFGCESGFTIVELLVVIGIISMLMALLIPAALRARSAARRTQCLHRMQQVGKALNQYALSKGHYPGRVDRMLNYISDSTVVFGGRDVIVSWVTKILPGLGHSDMYDAIIDSTRMGGHPYEVLRFLPEVVCPSDVTTSGDLPVLSFVVNCGIADPPTYGKPRDFVPDSPTNGVFHNMAILDKTFPYARRAMQVSIDYIARNDGTVNTLMLSENLDAASWRGYSELNVGFCWWHFKQGESYGINVKAGERPGRKSLGHANGRPIAGFSNNRRFARPSSFHTGGVNIIFCDGHGRFLRDDIPYRVYVQLMTPDSKKAMIDVYKGTPAPPEYKQLLSYSDFN